MGSFTIEIDAEKLKDILKKADRVCGTLEPSNRKLTFFPQEGKLYLMASDSCFRGYFELSPYLFSKPFQPFQISLDVVKQFSSELLGRVNLLFQDGIVTFKCQNEILRLRVNYIENMAIQKVPEKMVLVSKKKFLSDFDLASCFIEEGSNVDIFISPNNIELISHHSGMLSYIKLGTQNIEESEEKETFEFKSGSFSTSIPYVSARHIIKTFDLEEIEEIKIHFDELDQKMYILGNDIFTVCGDKPTETPEKIRNLCNRFQIQAKINAAQLQKLLRRSLISGRFSDTQLYTRNGELVVVSQHGGIAYKGGINTEINVNFSIKIKAHLLRSALNRMGSQNVLIGIVDDFVLFSSPSLTRFLILRNERVE